MRIGTGINPLTAGSEEEDHAGETTEPHLLLSTTRYNHTSEVGPINFNHEHFVEELNPAPTSGPKRQQLVAAGSGLPSTPGRDLCTFLQINTNKTKTNTTTPIGVWGGTPSLGARSIVQPKQTPQNKTNKTTRTYKKSKNNSQNKPRKHPQNINGVRDRKKGTNNDKITNLDSGKLTQTLILTFIKKGVKRNRETQLAPQWNNKLNTRIVFKTMSKRAKATNIKMVKDNRHTRKYISHANITHIRTPSQL